METSLLHVHIQNRIAQFTFNRQETGNTLSFELIRQLKEAFRAAEMDPRIKAIILSSEGTDFCLGPDAEYLQTVQTRTLDEQLADIAHLAELFKIMYRHKKPIIGQIQGRAISHGCTLVSCCDVVFAAADAQLGYPDVKWGFVPELAVAMLPKRLSLGHVRQLLLWGKEVPSSQALNLGLVDHVVPSEELEATVLTFAQNLCAQNSPGTIELLKRLLADVPEMPNNEALAFVCRIGAHSRKTIEFEIGVQAYQKQEPIDW